MRGKVHGPYVIVTRTSMMKRQRSGRTRSCLTNEKRTGGDQSKCRDEFRVIITRDWSSGDRFRPMQSISNDLDFAHIHAEQDTRLITSI